MRLHQRIRRERASHTDDWLMTYADTITLLLCLFVVILSIKTHEQMVPPSLAPAPPPAAAETFFSGMPPFHALTPITEPAPDTTPPEPLGELPEATPWLPTMPEARRPTMPEPPVARPLVPPIEVPSPPPPIVERMRSVGSAVVEQHGDRITTVEISSAAFFPSGFAALSTAGQAILRDVAVTLKAPGFAGYRFAIEGHTDDSPISTPRFQSNWELSTARAAAVVRYLLEQGIPARQLTAAGYADTFPLAPNRNADGTINPANQARNRRVVIKMEKIDKAAVNASFTTAIP